MPHPTKGETMGHFLGRFMGSGEARSDFKDPKQRAAVAYSMYRKRKRKK
jgi:hypothetical protein